MKIPKTVYNAILEQSKKDDPLETCGYLGGTNNEVTDIFPMVNSDKSPEHYAFDPKEQFKVLREARARGLSLVAVYHSHPKSPARLSEEDIRLALDPTLCYIICSLLDQNVKGYRVDKEKNISEETLEVF